MDEWSTTRSLAALLFNSLVPPHVSPGQSPASPRPAQPRVCVRDPTGLLVTCILDIAVHFLESAGHEMAFPPRNKCTIYNKLQRNYNLIVSYSYILMGQVRPAVAFWLIYMPTSRSRQVSRFGYPLGERGQNFAMKGVGVVTQDCRRQVRCILRRLQYPAYNQIPN